MSTTALNMKRKALSTAKKLPTKKSKQSNVERNTLSTAKKLPTKKSKQSDVASGLAMLPKLPPLPANFHPRYPLGLFYSWKYKDEPNVFDIYTKLFVRQIAELREGDDSVI